MFSEYTLTSLFEYGIYSCFISIERGIIYLINIDIGMIQMMPLGKKTVLSPVFKIKYAGYLVFVWLCIFYLCDFVFNQITHLNPNMAIFLSGLICALTVFVLLTLLIKTNISNKSAMLILIGCIVAGLGINQVVRVFQSNQNDMLLHLHAGINLSLIGVALCSGLLMSHIIKKKTYILSIAAAAGLADIWSVGFGVTNEIVKSRTAMNYLLFVFPVAGKGTLPLIGVTDFIFATMFLSLSYRFSLSIVKTQIFIAMSFIIAIFIAVVVRFGIPVLPIMGISFIVAHYKDIKITDPKEKRDTILGLIIISLLLVAATLIKTLI